MKGDMALEYPFKLLLYVVVILVVVGLIIAFNKQIREYLVNVLCQLLPQGCQSNGDCTTYDSTETVIDQKVLKYYCDACWTKTGRNEYQKDCLCYIVKGSFTPTTFTNENCELQCTKGASAVLFSYNHFAKTVEIKC